MASSGNAWQGIAMIFLGILLIGGITFGALKAIEYGEDKNWGVSTQETPLDLGDNPVSSFLEKTIIFLFGSRAENVQGLMLSLGFFVIMLFAITDILSISSAFSRKASWGIATGLGMIMSAAGVVNGFYDFVLKGAAITAYAIFVLIFALIAMFMVVNLLWGHLILRARISRKIADEVVQIQGGASVVSAALQGTGAVGQSFAGVGNSVASGKNKKPAP